MKYNIDDISIAVKNDISVVHSLMKSFESHAGTIRWSLNRRKEMPDNGSSWSDELTIEILNWQVH